MTEIRVGDIDIDVADRDLLLPIIPHVPASIQKDNGQWVRHNTGIYVTNIPTNPFTSQATIDYNQAEDRGYIKIDILNNTVYRLVRNRQHLLELVQQPTEWSRLTDADFFSRIVHIGNHYALYRKLSEPIQSLEQMAMFLALIRPAKRHLVGRSWNEIEQSIWTKSEDGAYGFKKSHAMSYSLLVTVHMKLLS